MALVWESKKGLQPTDPISWQHFLLSRLVFSSFTRPAKTGLGGAEQKYPLDIYT